MVSGNNPKISVIVPVYNVEQYLTRCIDSILAQTFTDFELLLIDDGSTDNSGKICDQYAKTDSRIRIFHKENNGVSSVRNKGIKEAKGKWIAFVDSDDWLNEKSLEKYIALSLQKDTLYIQQAKAVKGNVSEYWPSKFPNIRICLNNHFDYDIMNAVLIYGTPWGKLYNMEIIKENDLFFDEHISLHEDHCFYFDYIRFIQNVVVIDYVGYYYRINNKRFSLSARGNMPYFKNLIYAYRKLSDKLSLIVDKYGLDTVQLNHIYSFVYCILIRALRSCFYGKEAKSTCIKMLHNIDPKDISIYYHPQSISGKILKNILRCKIISLKYLLLSLIRNKLNK